MMQKPYLRSNWRQTETLVRSSLTSRQFKLEVLCRIVPN